MQHKVKPGNTLLFNRDAASRYVPLIIGLMVFLSTLTLFGTQAVVNYVRNWESSLTPGFTIEIPGTIHSLAMEQASNSLEEEILQAVKSLSGVKSVQIVAQSSLSPFVDPFEEQSTKSTFIDVSLQEGSGPISRQEIKSVLPWGTPFVLKNHREWRRSALSIAYAAILIGTIVSILTGLSAITTIAFVSKTGLLVHKNTIEILHLVGARHNYIAGQFQKYAFHLSFKGSLIGLCLISFSFILISWLMGIPKLSEYFQHTNITDFFLIVFLTPLTGIFLTVLSARFTVLTTLAKEKLS